MRRKVTVYNPKLGTLAAFLTPYFKPSPALTEVTCGGVRRFYNINGELIVVDEPVEEQD